MDRDPEVPADKVTRVNAAIAYKIAELYSMKFNKKATLLSNDVGGKGGISILAYRDDGTEYKIVLFTVLMQSQVIKIKYGTSDLRLAEENALAVRNAYFSQLRASSLQVWEP